MYVVIIEKADLAEHASALANVGSGHIPRLEMLRDDSSRDQKKTIRELMPRTLWIVIHGNEFLAVWVAGDSVTKEGIFPLDRLGTFLEEMRSGRGIG